jgi:hypothetical protein
VEEHNYDKGCAYFYRMLSVPEGVEFGGYWNDRRLWYEG